MRTVGPLDGSSIRASIANIERGKQRLLLHTLHIAEPVLHGALQRFERPLLISRPSLRHRNLASPHRLPYYRTVGEPGMRPLGGPQNSAFLDQTRA